MHMPLTVSGADYSTLLQVNLAYRLENHGEVSTRTCYDKLYKVVRRYAQMHKSRINRIH